MSFEEWFPRLIQASLTTLYMVGVSTLLTVLFGLPLGILLVVSDSKGLSPKPALNKILGVVVNLTRSLPFIILLVVLIPFTRWIAGTSIGPTAAIVPLTIAAVPFFARVTESALREVPSGLIEAAQAMGSSEWQIVSKVYIPEALPGLVLGVALTLINLLGYSAMAGAVGGGGLGDLAIRYGYQRFETEVMLVTVVLLVLFVQMVQSLGDRIAEKVSKR
ncbi:MAG: ABC transporter permease [Anaerolineaceae bacterium]|mgnify:FL=1|nr:ABC transporter permease [Anaerolineaceae bacterium]MDI9530846.1 methionine ABC transporter permease [Chloroflexota bacterium]